MNDAQALLCTVGAGDKNKIEESLLNPLKKSLRAGRWTIVVLLPSQETIAYAERLRAEMQPETPDRRIQIEPLPNAGDEDDARITRRRAGHAAPADSRRRPAND